MELPCRIPYNPRWLGTLLGAAFFGSGSALMACKAANNRIGATFGNMFRLGPQGATIFYWIISAFSAAFVIWSLLLVMRRLFNPKVLEVGTDALLLPHGRFQRQTSRIAYSDIQQITEAKISGQRFLHVIVGGRKYMITASLFPDNDSYTTLKDFLISRVRAHG